MRLMNAQELIQRYAAGKRDFSGADLRFADLSQLDLTGVDLSRAVLEGANLQRANLSFANLCGAHLERANLTDASFFYANLRRANLSEAKLAGADLRSANLTDAKLHGADLTDVDLWAATMPDGLTFSPSVKFAQEPVPSSLDSDKSVQHSNPLLWMVQVVRGDKKSLKKEPTENHQHSRNGSRKAK